MEEKAKIGISSCLLGYKLCWNAGHKLDRYLADTLEEEFKACPTCGYKDGLKLE